jgi:hypothetical protein
VKLALLLVVAAGCLRVDGGMAFAQLIDGKN